MKALEDNQMTYKHNHIPAEVTLDGSKFIKNEML